MENNVLMPKSRFLRVQCPACSNQQVIYNKAAMKVKCLACGKSLARPTGGESAILAKVLKVLE